MTASNRAAIRYVRDAVFEGLTSMARQLEELVAKAQKPGTPEHAELSVRRSMRVAQDIARKAIALRAIRDPEPWLTAPTRQREAKPSGPAQREVVTVGNTPVGVSHRWTWPVEAMHRRHMLTARQVHACARLRRAFSDMRFQPSTFSYGEDPPPRRGFVTPRDEQRIARQAERNEETGIQVRARLAGEEFAFVSARLEDELKAIAWVLILEQPLPGEDVAMSAVEFGQRISGMRTERDARAFALGALKMVSVRLDSIYRIWDTRRAIRPPSASPQVPQGLAPTTRV